jgi:hypothetical protein
MMEVDAFSLGTVSFENEVLSMLTALTPEYVARFVIAVELI